MNVFDLVAKISLDTSEYEKGISNVSNTVKKIGKGVAGVSAAVGAGAVALGSALVKNTGQVAAYGDNIDKMSQKMGISAQAYQEWDAIMKHSGTSIEALKPSMKTLASAAEKGSDAFEKLGISEEEVANLSQEDLFAKVIEGLQGMEEGTERTYITGQLLGRGATELGALLNTSAEDTEAMRQAVHDLGGVMSDEAVKAAAAYQDQLQDMQTAFSGLSRNLVSDFLPSVTSVMEGLTMIFSGETGGVAKVSEGVRQLVDNITSEVPNFLKAGTEIVMAIMEAITDNLPELLAAGADVVINILMGIVDMLPDIISAGVDMILALIDGIVNAIPRLIPALVKVVLAIVNKLTDPNTIVQLINVAFTLLRALGTGLINAIPQLLRNLPTIIGNVVRTLIQLAPQLIANGIDLMAKLATGILNGISNVINAVRDVMKGGKDAIMERVEDAKNWGKDLIGNFVSGIKNSISKVTSAAKSVASKVKSILGFSEPEEGPLSNFHTYAPDMMKLFAEGVRKNERIVTDQIAKSFDFGDTLVTAPELNVDTAESEIPFSVTINVYTAEGQDVRSIADEVVKRLTTMYDRRKAVYA